MKIVYKVLEDGFEQCVVEEDFEVVKPYTDIEPPQPNWKPVFDFQKKQWIETATEEDMQIPEVGLSESEKIMQALSDLEIDALKKDSLLEQLGQQVTDLEIQLLENGAE